MKPLLLLARWTCILVLSFVTAFLLMHFGRRTTAFKEHLYRQLLTGDENQRLHAASVLASIGGEAQLLRGLQEEEAQISQMARRGLEHIWFYSSGQEAYELMQAAYEAEEAEDHKGAMRTLDRLTRKYPQYAEGWNRRAAVLWKMGDYEKSRRDCERALKLNPNHYGAWQGLGVCELELGHLNEACDALRAALKIMPHDEATLRSLQQCEKLLRTRAPVRTERGTSNIL
jgi:tetratricopeptide (TPR) repeat protein